MPRIAKQDGYAIEPMEGVEGGIRRKVAAGTIVPDHYEDVEGGTTDVDEGTRIDPTVADKSSGSAAQAGAGDAEGSSSGSSRRRSSGSE